MTKVSFQLKTAGYCTASEWVVSKGRLGKKLHLPATYGLIHHPREGWLLFDTGNSRRFFAETARFPGKFYALMISVSVSEEEEAVAEVVRNGIAPEEIKYIIVSHFHGDHVGGLRDFPNARFICSEQAYNEAIALRGIRAVKKGILPGLLPEDLPERKILADVEPFARVEDPDLGELIDLFGDGSILLAMFPGHARGQMGALLNTNEGKVFLVADTCWLKQNYESDQLPRQVVRLFFDSWKDFLDSLQGLRNYISRNPETKIIPCHCEETRKTMIDPHEI